MNTLKKILRFIINHRRSFVFGLIALGVVLMLVFSNHGLLKRYEIIKDNKAIDAKIKDERAEQDSLRALTEKLRTDKTETERIAREHYGMIKPGERVFMVRPKEEKK
jgi:cell division protein FtsB